jgi:hypothetical protein
MRRPLTAGVLGTACAFHLLILDFWPLDFLGQSRTVFDLLGIPLFLLTGVAFMYWVVRTVVALFRCQFLRMASGMTALIALPAAFFVITAVPLFDPWLWYVVYNKSQFEAFAAKDTTPNGPRFAVIEERDVSTGIAGVAPNHFIALIYDEGDGVGREPSDPTGTRIYGHFFRRDYYQ